MEVLRELSPLVEPLSLDEAFVDLAAADLPDLEVETVTAAGAELRRRVQEVTGGLTATVGIASSKFLAKVASELDKPDGMTVVAPGTELDLLRPMKVKVIPGVGPATAERLRRGGHPHRRRPRGRRRGRAGAVARPGAGPRALAAGPGAGLRPVVAEREAKSISVEGTYDSDLTDRKLMEGLLSRQAREVGTRMRKNGISGGPSPSRSACYDFTTLSRSSTLHQPDRRRRDHRPDRALAARRPRHHRRRASSASASPASPTGCRRTSSARRPRTRRSRWSSRAAAPDVAAGRGRRARRDGRRLGVGLRPGVVTVRFETADTPPGPVRSFRADDPALHR